LHLWWARRPLAAARAVIFAQMVNDPGGERGYYAGKTRAQADAEREELFQILRDLVLWENTNNEEVLARARAAIAKSWRETCELNKGACPALTPIAARLPRPLCRWGCAAARSPAPGAGKPCAST
jgi:adenine-specific DNA methylase